MPTRRLVGSQLAVIRHELYIEFYVNATHHIFWLHSSDEIPGHDRPIPLDPKRQCSATCLPVFVHYRQQTLFFETDKATAANQWIPQNWPSCKRRRPPTGSVRLSFSAPSKLACGADTNIAGGKGTVRRKIVRKPKASNAQDDKKLQGALKKLNLQPIQGVEEVNMFREDGNVLHFSAPKGESLYPQGKTHSFDLRLVTVHAAVSANTFAIYGAGQVKELTELVPGILNQLGPDSLASLRKLAESYQAIQQGRQGAGPGAPDDDDEDVPDLVENFDVEEQKKEDKEDGLEELN